MSCFAKGKHEARTWSVKLFRTGVANESGHFRIYDMTWNDRGHDERRPLDLCVSDALEIWWEKHEVINCNIYVPFFHLLWALHFPYWSILLIPRNLFLQGIIGTQIVYVANAVNNDMMSIYFFSTKHGVLQPNWVPEWLLSQRLNLMISSSSGKFHVLELKFLCYTKYDVLKAWYDLFPKKSDKSYLFGW